MSRIALNPEQVRDFGARLQAVGRRRIGHDEIWRAFGEAFRDRPPGVEGRRWLLAALEELEQERMLRIPSSRSRRWDRAFLPHVPISVDLSSPVEQPRDESWRMEPWPIEMSWVPDLVRPTEEHLRFLRAVRTGLREGRLREPVPLRHRSLQLTGDEKRLERYMATSLFGEGRLNAEMLGFYTVVLPLVWERVQPGGRVIVFENKESFILARSVLQSLANPPYDIVAFGNGQGIEQSVAHLCTIGCAITTLDYVGDLDPPGLDFPTRAAAVALQTGSLPPLRPAPGLHARMLRAAAALGHASGWDDKEGRRPLTSAAIEWLPADVRAAVLEMVAGGRRIAEEVLGPADMRDVWSPTPSLSVGRSEPSTR